MPCKYYLAFHPHTPCSPMFGDGPIYVPVVIAVQAVPPVVFMYALEVPLEPSTRIYIEPWPAVNDGAPLPAYKPKLEAEPTRSAVVGVADKVVVLCT